MTTRRYYDEHSHELARRYELAAVSELQHRVLQWLTGCKSVLEVGCGSGREASLIAARGVHIVASDASFAMLERAVERHGELKERVLLVALPGPLPFRNSQFDAVVAIAVLMHLTREDIGRALMELHRVLQPDGRLIVSVPARRNDLDTEGRDTSGRRFTCLEKDEWTSLLRDAGFAIRDSRETADGLGRSGVQWFSCLGERS